MALGGCLGAQHGTQREQQDHPQAGADGQARRHAETKKWHVRQ
jgi:hypothetical protein